jgi:hypothetical protein
MDQQSQPPFFVVTVHTPPDTSVSEKIKGILCIIQRHKLNSNHKYIICLLSNQGLGPHTSRQLLFFIYFYILCIHTKD